MLSVFFSGGKIHITKRASVDDIVLAYCNINTRINPNEIKPISEEVWNDLTERCVHCYSNYYREELTKKPNEVDHPAHYGGDDDPYEAIKVIEAWELGFNLGNCIKYVCRAGQKEGTNPVVDLQKARWYLDREIQNASVSKSTT